MRGPPCVGRMCGCRTFSLVSGLPSRLSAVGCPSLFEPFIGVVNFVVAPTFVWSSPFVIGSTPWSFFFTAQYPACPCPCLRFASSLSTDGARLGVRMDHYSFPARLFHSQHHAGLSRRTTNPVPFPDNQAPLNFPSSAFPQPSSPARALTPAQPE